VSTPIAWDELSRDVRLAHFNVKNVPQRLAKMKNDPWQKLAEKETALTKTMMAKVGYTAR
jgi:bifunctional non-homologous end joining protein LigD